MGDHDHGCEARTCCATHTCEHHMPGCDRQIRVVIEATFDRVKADAYNAELYGGDASDPVQGDGKSLIADVVGDSGLDEVLRFGLSETLVSLSVTIDGEPMRYPKR